LQRYIDWDLPDPKGQPTEQVRAIREEIQQRVRQLISDLDEPKTAAKA
jgi:protein-tyrosine-phosphatase